MSKLSFEVCGFILLPTIILGSIQFSDIVNWIAVLITGNDAGWLANLAWIIWGCAALIALNKAMEYTAEKAIREERNKAND